MRVDNSVCIVTGAGGGIGAALSRRLVEAGARVVATDLDAGRLHSAVDSIAADHPGTIVGLAGDCSADEHIRATIALAEHTFGASVDLYAANAGVSIGADLLDSSAAAWQTSLDVNVMAHVRAAELLVPGWLERGAGHFLTTASAAGLLTQIGSPTYSVTKHAAVAFAEWLSVTYGARGIGVSCLCPMGVDTAMLESDSTDDGAQQMIKAVTESGQVLEPLDVADLVVAALGTDEFLILPHPEVLEFFRRKADDYDRWLRGMRRYRDSLA
ncbi:SDR family oxidoreductase [Nocardia sp. NPDC004568]|uniref:SDR family oxidoreductase n=1 Tax=Nocardia sp. NPDC004568 TaxID=3154551 RepID=UPI0033B2FF61